MEVIPEEKGFSLKKVWNSRPGRRQSVTARFYVHFKSPDDVMKEHEQASLPRAMSETRLQRRASLLLPWRKGVDSGFQSTTSFPAPQPQRHLDEETPAHADVIAPSISRSPRRILPSSSAAAVREHAGTTIRAPTPYAIPVPLDLHKEMLAMSPDDDDDDDAVDADESSAASVMKVGHVVTQRHLPGSLQPHRPAPPPPTTSGQHLLNKGATTNTRPKSAVYQTGATSGAVVVVTALTAGAIAGNNQALGARLACAGPQYQQSESEFNSRNRLHHHHYNDTLQNQQGRQPHQETSSNGFLKGPASADQTEGTLLQKFKKTFSWRFSNSNNNVPPSGRQSNSRRRFSGPTSLPHTNCACHHHHHQQQQQQQQQQQGTNVEVCPAAVATIKHSSSTGDAAEDQQQQQQQQQGFSQAMTMHRSASCDYNNPTCPWDSTNKTDWRRCSSSAAAAAAGCANAALDDKVQHRRQQQQQQSTSISALSKRLSGDSGIMMMCDAVPTDVQAKNRQSQSTLTGAYSLANNNNNKCVSGLCQHAADHHLCSRQQQEEVVQQVMLGAAASSGSCATVSRQCFNQARGDVADADGSDAVLQRVPAAAAATATAVFPRLMLLSNTLPRPAGGDPTTAETRNRVYAKNKDSKRRFQQRNGPSQQHPTPMAELVLPSVNPLLWRSSSQPSDLNVSQVVSSSVHPSVVAGQQPTLLSSEASAAAAAAFRARSMRRHQQSRRRCRNQRRSVAGVVSDDDVLDVGHSSRHRLHNLSSSSLSSSCSLNNNNNNNNSSSSRRTRRFDLQHGEDADADDDDDDDDDDDEDDDADDDDEEGRMDAGNVGNSSSSCNDSGHHGSESQCSSGNNDQGDFLETNGLMLAEALWDHSTTDADELAFRAGDVIEVLDTSFQQWWWGELHHQPSIGAAGGCPSNNNNNNKPAPAGWFPAAFVRLRVSPEGVVLTEELMESSESRGEASATGAAAAEGIRNSTTTPSSISSLDVAGSSSASAADNRHSRVKNKTSPMSKESDEERSATMTAGGADGSSSASTSHEHHASAGMMMTIISTPLLSLTAAAAGGSDTAAASSPPVLRGRHLVTGIPAAADAADDDDHLGGAGGGGGGLQTCASSASVTTLSGGAAATGLNRRSSILLSHDQVRGNIIKEIISSEKEFLKNLCDIKQGYLHQVRRRPDMFTKEHVSTIFGNIEALYEFQSEFVGYLESKINTKQPHKSCVGECFKKYRTGFKVYTEYCNNHPSAVATLQELNEDPNICHFFEACRLLQKMIDISLDGFLLTPVQRICKYPLQLAELAKYTKPDHLDHHDVLEALEEMRGAASAVNESRRRREALESLVAWEASVTGWDHHHHHHNNNNHSNNNNSSSGNNNNHHHHGSSSLLDTSSIMLHQGDVFILKGSSAVSQKSKDLTLFLFDHLLVYCRRDLLKKTSFVWKGKIPLDECRIEDCPDGKDEHLGVPLKNAWKVVNTVRSHYFLFYTRTAEEKLEWMRAFGRERAQVRQDLEQGIVFTEREKEDARRAALATRTNSKFNKKPKGKPSKVKLDPDVMASFMRQMNPASYSAAASTTTTTNNTIPHHHHHHHHPRMVHTTGSLSRLPHTSSGGGGPSQQQVMHYRNDVRYHSNSASSSSSMSNTSTSTSTSTGPRTVVMERTHRKDMRMYVGMDAEDEDEDGEDAWHSTTTTTNNGATTMPNTTTNTNSLSKKKSAWFNFGQKRSTTTSTISTSRELPANSTFYTTA